MAELMLIQSVRLANDIYTTQKDQKSVDLFFETHANILSNSQQTTMKAKVGSRLINTRDTFGVCGRCGSNDFPLPGLEANSLNIVSIPEPEPEIRRQSK